MNRLFDSKGHHIANESGGRLYSPHGSNVGRLIDKAGIFVDLRGRYLGEIVHGNRFLRNRCSPFRATSYGSTGTTGSVGSAGTTGSIGSIAMPSGFEDVAPEDLK